MLAQFGRENDPVFRQSMTAATGAGVCGEEGRQCGNGSLMRILTASLYALAKCGPQGVYSPEAMELIHNMSRVTHASPRCLIACGLYSAVVWELMAGRAPVEAVREGLERAGALYEAGPMEKEYRKYFFGMTEKSLLSLEQEDVSGSGYVIDALVAALWCLLTTENYRECVLRAVNLGEDTDTVAAVAGGLAGIAWGLQAIPESWADCLARKAWIDERCAAFEDCLAAVEQQRAL